MGQNEPEPCSSTAKYAKHAKELPVFKALTPKKLESRSGRFRSGSPAPERGDERWRVFAILAVLAVKFLA